MYTLFVCECNGNQRDRPNRGNSGLRRKARSEKVGTNSMEHVIRVFTGYPVMFISLERRRGCCLVFGVPGGRQGLSTTYPFIQIRGIDSAKACLLYLG